MKPGMPPFHPNSAGSTEALRIASMLRDEILRGDLRPGARLISQQLAYRFGVSLTPVREAIKALIAENLAIYRPHQGASVLSVELLDCRDVWEIYGIRSALEMYATAEATTLLDAEGLERIQTIHHGLKLATKQGLLTSFVAQNASFHTEIVGVLQNRRLMSELRRHWIATPSGVLEAVERRSRESLEEHEAILLALQRRDPAAASRAAGAHVQGSLRMALAVATHAGHSGHECDFLVRP